MKTKNAFTLIELLIVVAIIAVLAAIATPNLLEAQTRAKVGRAKADLKAIIGALGVYHVDNFAYPSNVITLAESPRRPRSLDSSLTTPIAYMSSVPRDVFISKRGLYQNLSISRLYVCAAVMIASEQMQYPSGEIIPDPETRNLMMLAGFDLRSAGTDGVYDSFSISGFSDPAIWSGSRENRCNLVYDPTNGSVSRGDICATSNGLLIGKGVFF